MVSKMMSLNFSIVLVAVFLLFKLCSSTDPGSSALPVSKNKAFKINELVDLSMDGFHGASDEAFSIVASQEARRNAALDSPCSVSELTRERKRLFRALNLLQKRIKNARGIVYSLEPCRKRLKIALRKIDLIVASLNDYDYASSHTKLEQVKVEMITCRAALDAHSGVKGIAEYKRSDDTYSLSSLLLTSSASCFAALGSSARDLASSLSATS